MRISDWSSDVCSSDLCYQCVHLKIRIFLPKCGYIMQDSILKKLAFETDLIRINELWSNCRRNVSTADWRDGDSIVPPRLESTRIFRISYHRRRKLIAKPGVPQQCEIRDFVKLDRQQI